ncbi:alpha/beta-hydrolase [Ascoidea rubescens DSM 1968]|uniref:Carboxypeptidase n=1 Tax=Ascoidea rubescens DSM 1968 TaxID=1344418 RepID=A0A1D2VRD4_9ASCO|nr:alpha/beta-hydrolase [Ascoidea rubescens DSM 1968]ODV64127.1 alpha/beta-hydrolase [Ascoidea rubescens DSM 1968]
MDGALMEIGPFRISKNSTITLNNGTWLNSANLLFIDQPSNTGFSYSNTFDKDLDQISFNFYNFLQNYFLIFTQDFSDTVEIYLAGESYAGQYLPFFAEYLLNNYKDLNLKGVLIGNAWIYPNLQSLSYLPWFKSQNLLSSSIISPNNNTINNINNLNLITQYHNDYSKSKSQLQSQLNDSLLDVNINSQLSCDLILDSLLNLTRLNNSNDINNDCLNIYDYRLRDSYPACGANWPSDLTNVTPFLSNPHIQKNLNLNINFNKWAECNSSVSKHLLNQNIKPSFTKLSNLLVNKNLPILLFNGNKDIICNQYSLELVTQNLKFDGNNPLKLGFSDSIQYVDWFVKNNSNNNKKVSYNLLGKIKYENNLYLIEFINASHMVPYDNSIGSLGLLDIFWGNFKWNSDISHDNQPVIVTPNHPNSFHLSNSIDNSNSNSNFNFNSKNNQTFKDPMDDNRDTFIGDSTLNGLNYFFFIIGSVVVIFYFTIRHFKNRRFTHRNRQPPLSNIYESYEMIDK